MLFRTPTLILLIALLIALALIIVGVMSVWTLYKSKNNISNPPSETKPKITLE